MLDRSLSLLRRVMFSSFAFVVAGGLVVLLLLPHAPPTDVALAVPEQKIAPAVLVLMQSSPWQRIPIILEMKPASAPFRGPVNQALAQQALSILQAHGQAFGALAIVNGAAGFANAAEIQAMSLLPQVSAIDYDATVGPRQPSTARPRPVVPLASLYTREVHADRVWSRGGSGRGVTVAVLDSGVARDRDLTRASNRVLASVSFVGARDPQRLDAGGHGTHVAGTIAGDGSSSAGQYIGIAPRANVVDVQVLDANGRGRVSSVLAGLQWVLAHRAQYNIRVVNMSFGAKAQDSSYRTDPLAAGVEIAWRSGLIVVTASGNTGPDRGSVETPGIDPYVLTVGSTDDRATLSLADDSVAWFSAWGTPPGSTAKPDLIAPGRQVVSLRVPGSALDVRLPDRVVNASNGTTYFRLSGTSMSTAVVSGAVALMLEQRPSLTPDQVKRVLVTATQPFGSSGPLAPGSAAGAGLLDAYRATTAPAAGAANQGLRPADAFARVLYPLVYGQPLVWKDPNYLGQSWSTLTWATLDWSASAWDNIAWDNIAWDNIAWDNIAWDNIAWDNIAWDNIAWDNIAWDNIAWDNIAWDDAGSN